MVKTDLKYTTEHEWVRVEDMKAVIGITDFAQESLGDVVYVDLPEVGTQVVAGNAFGAVESVKSVSDLYSPVSGTVSDVNESLGTEPELVNKDPYGEGWMVIVAMSDSSEVDLLLNAVQYENTLKEGQ